MEKNIVKIALKNTITDIVLLVILSMAISYVTLQISLQIKYAVDEVLFSEYQQQYGLVSITAFIILLYFVQKAISYWRDRTTTKFQLKINVNLKQELYRHMLNLEYESYRSYDKTEIMQRINEDADVYSKFFNSQFNVILDVVFLSIFILKESVELNAKIALYIFSTILIMLLFSLWYYKKLNKSIENMIIKRKRLLKETIRNVNHFKLIRMFNKQKEERENYQKLNNEYSREEIKFIKLVLFYDIILEHLTYLKSPIIYMIGGIAMIHGETTMGSLIALHTFADKIFQCLYTFGDNLESIDDFQVVTKKINQLLRQKEESKENHEYDLNGEIIFSNVSIRIDEKVILKDINLIIQPGEKVAIIGENGSGKSVLAKTILGFYPYEGNIYLNHHNLKRLNKRDVRRYVELILGESYLFSGSVLENIQLHQSICEEKLDSIAVECEIKEDIDQFEDKYNTRIGEKGTKLSGGQKQRISLARSIVNNKPIFILDEAFNKLDNRTRRNILTNLIRKYGNKTMLLISNDLEMINYADQIIFIDGTTTIKGTHDELLKRNENYRNLIQIREDVV